MDKNGGFFVKKLFVFIIAILGFAVPCKGMQYQGDELGFKAGIAAGAAATAAAAAAATKAYNWYYSTGGNPEVKSDYINLEFDLYTRGSDFYYLKQVANILNELYKNPDCGRMSKKDKLDNILCSIYGCKNQEKPDEKLIAIFNKSIEEEHKKLVKKIEKYLHYFEDEKVAKMTKFIIGERFSLTGKDFIEILGDPEQYELKEVVYIKYLILEEAYKQVDRKS